MRSEELKNKERKAYSRLLRYLLSEEIQAAFTEQHELPTPRIAELMQRLDEPKPDRD
jgi:ABC-type Fe3+ transport system substrate-binding protein